RRSGHCPTRQRASACAKSSIRSNAARRHHEGVNMRTILLPVGAVAAVVALIGAFTIGRLSAQEPTASCRMCPSTYVPASEIAEFTALGRADLSLIDQQMRALDIGKSQVEIALVHRGK